MTPKRGVDLADLRPEIRRLEPLIDAVYNTFGILAVVTSTNHDGYEFGRKLHRANSLHYDGLALDLRVKHVGKAKLQTTLHAALVRAIDADYPGQYDVLLEGAGSVNAHIHIEASPVLLASLKAEAVHA